jgi:NAD(P)-dependent dehydrogenase (short-subunit alcohol dehydrogenase family)
MAKAALNMITRTCSMDFKQIYMNSVDTGWVTNENPHNIAEHMALKHKFKCPLDCIDGAMRVLDPIYQGVNEKLFPYGEFIKNYQSSLW